MIYSIYHVNLSTKWRIVTSDIEMERSDLLMRSETQNEKAMFSLRDIQVLLTKLERMNNF